MAYITAERWSRNCGSGGLGPSQAIAGDGYSPGILEGNWNEDYSGRTLKATGKTAFNYGAPARTTSTQQESYNGYGKTGEDLQYISQRQDRELHNQGQHGDVLFRHGNFLQEPMDCATSLYSLTHGEKQLGEPGVQTYLWSGNNRHDRTVPLKTSTLDLTRKKANQWKEDMDPYSSFKTTSRSAALASALPAAEHPSRTATLRPASDGGELAQVGRKPVGPHQQECEKNYRRIGMRDTYCTFLTTNKQ